jgi:hypothetical protein
MEGGDGLLSAERGEPRRGDASERGGGRCRRETAVLVVNALRVDCPVFARVAFGANPPGAGANRGSTATAHERRLVPRAVGM